MGHDFTTDEQHVYFNGKPLPGSDPATFTRVDEEHLGVQHVPHYFAFDNRNLYADGSAREGVQIWNDVDTSSLQFFPGLVDDFFADRSHLFRFNGHFIEYLSTTNYPDLVAELRGRLPEADAWWNWDDDYYRSLQPLSETYYTDGRRVFYHFDINRVRPEGTRYYNYPFHFGDARDQSYFSVLPDVSADSFEPLNDYYARSSTGIHHLARPIEADALSFRTIDGHIAVDTNHTWHGGYPCKETIDADSFEVLDVPPGYTSFLLAKDKSRLYTTRHSVRIGRYKGYSELLVALPNSDPMTLEVLSHAWARDRSDVYRYGEICKDIHTPTFEFLVEDFSPTYLAVDRGSLGGEHSYAKDARHLYDAHTQKVVKGIDGGSFVMLNDFWGKDAHVVFCFKTGKILKELDAASFFAVGDAGEAEDENHALRFMLRNDGRSDYLELEITRKN